MSSAAAKKQRPKFLSFYALLFQIRMPIPAWCSGMHRISGALLVFPLTAWFLFLLDTSLASEQGYRHVRDVYLSHPIAKLGLTFFIWAYSHHFCAGIRYLFLDLNKGIDLRPARASAYAVFAVSILITLYFGWRLWL